MQLCLQQPLNMEGSQDSDFGRESLPIVTVCHYPMSTCHRVTVSLCHCVTVQLCLQQPLNMEGSKTLTLEEWRGTEAGVVADQLGEEPGGREGAGGGARGGAGRGVGGRGSQCCAL